MKAQKKIAADVLQKECINKYNNGVIEGRIQRGKREESFMYLDDYLRAIVEDNKQVGTKVPIELHLFKKQVRITKKKGILLSLLLDELLIGVDKKKGNSKGNPTTVCLDQYNNLVSVNFYIKTELKGLKEKLENDWIKKICAHLHAYCQVKDGKWTELFICFKN